ncbi:MAG: signal peptidase I [Gammaproteobacteria bacterium]|nr:signal peptidase I [Gammaproteobacteria bacterium]
MNFALYLFIGLILSGLVRLYEILWLKTHPIHNRWFNKGVKEVASFFPILLIVLLLRSFLVEPFRIPSSSLEPTLLVGDFVVVNKFIYGIRLPIIEKKVIAVKEPKRGDIVVFRWPPNPQFDFIKRVIGLPGDTISYQKKQLYINGEAVNLNAAPITFDKKNTNVYEYIEALPGVSHHIFQKSDTAAFDFSIKVPKDHYFVMGDNRDNSADSRFWGFVPESYLRGQAFGIWMSWDGEHYKVRFNRIAKAIH